jgi:hypothetical protein
MLCLDNSFCSGQSCRSTRYLVRQNLKVLTISIMLLGRIHFNMVLLTAHNYAQRSAVCGCCRRVAVARVFALVVRCRVKRLLLFSRVGKNRDTGGSPRRCRGGLCRCTPNDPLWLEISRGTEGNAIYRPVRDSSGLFVLSWRRKDLTRVQLNRLLNLLAKPLHIP